VKTQGTGAALTQTVAHLQGGVLRLRIGSAIPLIAGWEGTLAATNLPELRGIAENLRTLRAELASDNPDGTRVSRLLTTLGAQVQALTTSPVGFPIAVPLAQLSLLLTAGGAAIASHASLNRR
jgi:hypothetical protein